MARGLGLDRAGGASAGVAPGGPAGGDLTGTYPNPTVDGLQGVALSGTAPVDGDLIVFDGVSWKHSASDSAGGTVVLNTAAEAATLTWGAAATSVSVSQAQDASAAGAVFSIRAQQGFAGFAGGNLVLGAGNGGTPGTDAPGNTNLRLGTPVANVSGLFRLTREDDVLIVSINQRAGPLCYIENGPSSAAGIIVNASSGLAQLSAAAGSPAVLVSAGGAQLWAAATNYQWYQAGALARLDVVSRTGANSMTWEAPVTSVTYTTLTRATDSACASTTLQSQAPNAGATGTNRTPGQLNLVTPAAVGGGTEAKIQLGLGAATGLYFQKITSPIAASAQFFDTHGLITTAAVGAGASGFSLFVLAGAAGSTGARQTGGDVSISGGDAGGTTGANAHGGEVSLSAGTGSTSDGSGGGITIETGNGGTTNGPAGTLALATGGPQGTGVKGEIQFWQNTIAGTKIGYFDVNGQLHVGADADTTLTNLRINGATQTTVGALGGAAALPALPTGYLPVNIKGTEIVIPYYDKA